MGSLKRTIFVNGGIELLQMVSEANTRRCVNENVELRKGWTLCGVPARTLCPEAGWIVRSHIDYWNETFFIRVLKLLQSRRF